MILSTFTCIVCMAVNPGVEAAGGPKDSTLYSTVYRQDSLLFAAFNSGNFELFKRFFSGELQIYQDNIGVRNYDESVAAFEGLFTGNYKLTRTLLKETLEVYPIKNFGAIETGQHTFCHPENGKPDCGTYKFVHIWTNQKGTWKIVKIITYNH
jgi:hypothetical protein